MMKHFFQALKLTIGLILICCVIYPLIMLGIAQFAPNHGHGFVVKDKDGKTYFENIGQKFTSDKYFHSRPSAVDYDAAGSGGSNKGPNDPEYLKTVKERIKAFHAESIKDIPVDLVTASGSGLDPDISVAGAKIQAKRVAKARHMKLQTIYQLIDEQTDSNWFGPSKINVLKLNIALDKLKS